MERIDIRAARVASSERTPKAAAAVAFSGSLLGGADNVQAVSLTAATLAVAEMAQNRFGVKGFRPSDSRSPDNKPGGRIGSVASRTP